MVFSELFFTTHIWRVRANFRLGHKRQLEPACFSWLKWVCLTNMVQQPLHQNLIKSSTLRCPKIYCLKVIILAFNHEKHAGSSCRLWPSRKFARTRQTCVVKKNSLKTMTYQVAQLLFICSRDTMCLDLFLLVHFIMIPKMFVSIISHWFNVLSLAQKWTHNPKK